MSCLWQIVPPRGAAAPSSLPPFPTKRNSHSNSWASSRLPENCKQNQSLLAKDSSSPKESRRRWRGFVQTVCDCQAEGTELLTGSVPGHDLDSPAETPTSAWALNPSQLQPRCGQTEPPGLGCDSDSDSHGWPRAGTAPAWVTMPVPPWPPTAPLPWHIPAFSHSGSPNPAGTLQAPPEP